MNVNFDNHFAGAAAFAGAASFAGAAAFAGAASLAGAAAPEAPFVAFGFGK